MTTNFGPQSSPGMSAAAQGQPCPATGKLPPGYNGRAGHPSIDADAKIENFTRQLAANQEDLDPRISWLIDKHFWDLF